MGEPPSEPGGDQVRLADFGESLLSFSFSGGPGTSVKEYEELSELLLVKASAREPVCEISLGARDLALRLANKRTTSLPG